MCVPATRDARIVAQVEVVLKDFDGTRTICRATLPLQPVIHADEKDLGVTLRKSYVQSSDQDEQGRTIYVERR